MPNRPPSRPAKTQIIGHRGARGHAPENTLLGIETGLALGAEGIEFDVQRHPCGELLLLHDDTVDRTTNGKGRFVDLSYTELRNLDAGGGERLPTLAEALTLLSGRGVAHIELKSWNGTAEAVALELMRQLDNGASTSDFVVSSFHLPELARFHARLPSIAVGALVAGVPLALAATAEQLGASALHLGDDFIDPDLIDDARARRLGVRVYTVNDATTMATLFRLGIDGLITDFPDQALALRDSIGSWAAKPGETA